MVAGTKLAMMVLVVAFSMSCTIRPQEQADVTVSSLEESKARDQATAEVYKFYKDSIRTQVEKQYPNMPEEQREQIVDSEFQKFLKNNKDTVEGNIDDAVKFHLYEQNK